MGSIENSIVELIAKQTGSKNFSNDSDLCYDLGVDGDDMTELLEAYSKQFEVDMSSYVWYFHQGEEGLNLNPLLLFAKKPFKEIPHIPVTVRLLAQFVDCGKWSLNYPEHDIPNRTKERKLNITFLAIMLVLVGLVMGIKFLR